MLVHSLELQLREATEGAHGSQCKHQVNTHMWQTGAATQERAPMSFLCPFLSTVESQVNGDGIITGQQCVSAQPCS